MVNYKNWLIFTLCSLFTLSLLYSFMNYRCNFLNSGEIAWIHDCIKKKETIARNIAGKKIVFDGGSATLFGVKTKVIEGKIGVPCINMATHASLSIDYVFTRLKNILNKRDIVILPLEYSHFTYDGKLNSMTLDYILSFDKNFYRSLPYSLRLKYLISISPIDVFRAIILRIINNHGVYDVKTLNDNGDETGKIGNDNISRRAQFFKPLEIPSGNFHETYGLAKINQLNIWCKQHDVTLYITYANLIYLKEYDDNNYRNYFDSLNNYFLDHNIKTIGTPYDFFFNKEFFYDSPYHMNEQGAIIRTTQLLEMLTKSDVIKFAKNN